MVKSTLSSFICKQGNSQQNFWVCNDVQTLRNYNSAKTVKLKFLALPRLPVWLWQGHLNEWHQAIFPTHRIQNHIRIYRQLRMDKQMWHLKYYFRYQLLWDLTLFYDLKESIFFLSLEHKCNTIIWSAHIYYSMVPQGLKNSNTSTSVGNKYDILDVFSFLRVCCHNQKFSKPLSSSQLYKK